MKRVLLFTLLSSFVFADAMNGWNNSSEAEELKAQEAEQERMCKLYIVKVKKYKETTRDDEMAQATLNNYVRLQTKYCKEVDSNITK